MEIKQFGNLVFDANSTRFLPKFAAFVAPLL